MKILLNRLFGGLKGIFFIVVVCIGLALHLYTQHIINQLRDEARSLVLFYAQMYARVAETESQEDLSFLFDQIIRRTNFPLIQTDSHKIPVGWKGIDVNPNDFSEEARRKVQRMVNRMDRSIDAVPIKYKETVLGYLFYGDSRLIQQIQWLPYVEVGILGLFILIGFIGYANIKRSEQRYIWVGMAKETAHQLGTPLSSLLGWLEVMRSGKKYDRDQVIWEMDRDLQRLGKVSERFSRIGSKPDLKRVELNSVIREVVEYIERRVPQMGRRVVVTDYYQNVGSVALDPDLFQWAIENIMKNSLDAIDKDKGEIANRLGMNGNGRSVYIEIQDNGRGLDNAQRRRIFKPGYSTKKRGWGLGLTLAKRIIEEYHDGKLYIKETRPGEGTVVRIDLKK